MKHIWLPDDRTQIQVDMTNPRGEEDREVTVYQERFTMILQPIDPPSGFRKKEEADDR